MVNGTKILQYYKWLNYELNYFHIHICIVIQVIKSLRSLYGDGNYRNCKCKKEMHVFLFFFLYFFTVNWTTFDQSCPPFLCEEHARCHICQAATATHLTFVWLCKCSTAAASSRITAENQPMDNSPTQVVFIALGLNESSLGGDPIPHLAWDHLWIPQEMNLGHMGVWNTLLSLLTPWPDPR